MREPREDTPWWTLRLLYGGLPIVAGLDKFTNVLTDWTKYLNPVALKIVPVSAPTFMHLVGVIEIVAGLLVLSRVTRFGAYMVSAWLAAIAISLLATGTYLDVAVRDLAMSVGALTLAKLTELRGQRSLTVAKNHVERDRRHNPVLALR